MFVGELRYFQDDPVLIVDDGQNARGWDLANYATVVNTLETSVATRLDSEQNDDRAGVSMPSRAAASTLIKQTFEDRPESEVRRRVADAIEDSKPSNYSRNAREEIWSFEHGDAADVEDPLSYFCELYPDASNSGDAENVYLGFNREPDQLVRHRVQNPTVFWSTTGAIGQARLE